MTRGVVLVSGGMDSCVTAAIAAGECRPAFLHVSYGQRTETRERSSFLAIAEHYGVVDRLEARLDHLKAIGGSSLTDIGIPVEVAEPGRRGIPRTYVPFRNAQLLSIAVSWAEVIGATRVYIGAVEEDSSGYPDCRREFFDAFETMIHAGTLPETNISIRSPVIGMRKEAIVRKGLELAAPFHLTWSCYREERVACGTCDSCALRLRAFAEAGVTDPIPYAPASR